MPTDISKRIIYPYVDGIAIIIPVACGLTVEQIAAKDVPSGTPFRIVAIAEVPVDRTFRAAWESDFTTYDGVGD